MVCKKRLVYKGRCSMDHGPWTIRLTTVKKMVSKPLSIVRLMTRLTFCRSAVIAGW
jgi:hypothetical protein